MKLETVTGQLIDIANPDPATINIEDIAWSLSRISRFCGHTVTAIPYNVGQHSLFVATEIESMFSESDVKSKRRRIALLGLLHDAAEAYTGDLPSPIKHLPELRPIIVGIEHNLMRAVLESLRLQPPTEEEEIIIKTADRIAQKIEAHAFMQSRGKHWEGLPDVSLERLQQFSAPLDSLTSYKMFMDKFNALTAHR